MACCTPPIRWPGRFTRSISERRRTAARRAPRMSPTSPRRLRRCSAPMPSRSTSPIWQSTRGRTTPSCRSCGDRARPPDRHCCASTAPARSPQSIPDRSSSPASICRILPANAEGRNQRAQAITQVKYANGRVWASGLSNEEFASKLWSVAYPFAKADAGTSVEIYHGNHQQLETRAPMYAFIPYTIGERAVCHRRVSVHAAREVPGFVRSNRRQANRTAARRSASSAPATGRST